MEKRIMHAPLITKYEYQIRSRNGAIVDNLQIYGRTEEEAKKKLEQMYRNCEILQTRVVAPERSMNSSYDEVLSLIAGG
jgi:DNA-nicking Smr family endonuclease